MIEFGEKFQYCYLARTSYIVHSECKTLYSDKIKNFHREVRRSQKVEGTVSCENWTDSLTKLEQWISTLPERHKSLMYDVFDCLRDDLSVYYFYKLPYNESKMCCRQIFCFLESIGACLYKHDNDIDENTIVSTRFTTSFRSALDPSQSVHLPFFAKTQRELERKISEGHFLEASGSSHVISNEEITHVVGDIKTLLEFVQKKTGRYMARTELECLCRISISSLNGFHSFPLLTRLLKEEIRWIPPTGTSVGDYKKLVSVFGDVKFKIGWLQKVSKTTGCCFSALNSLMANVNTWKTDDINTLLRNVFTQFDFSTVWKELSNKHSSLTDLHVRLVARAKTSRNSEKSIKEFITIAHNSLAITHYNPNTALQVAYYLIEVYELRIVCYILRLLYPSWNCSSVPSKKYKKN
jgi:hypothetical protein